MSWKSLSLILPQLAAIHHIKAGVRLKQVVLQYIHNEWSSITRWKMCGQKCYHMQWQVKTHWHTIACWMHFRSWKASKTGCVCNISIFADLGNRGHPAVLLLHSNPLIHAQFTIAIPLVLPSLLLPHMTHFHFIIYTSKEAISIVFVNFPISSSVFSF